MKIKVEIDTSGILEQIIKETKKANKPAPKPKASPEDSRAAELTMRLMSISGDSTDEKSVQAEIDVIAYVKELLASGRKKDAVQFLNDNKHRFTPEMKDGLTDIINTNL